ncbi:MAG: Mur ligase family protein [Desulforegulaceae bacterium]|nr:Mur ligase family protein [Desulforegulaceae bacterium]
MAVKKNFPPEQIKNIHLISACGTAMGALCAMLSDKGYNLTGSDQGIYPPMSTFLESRNIVLKEFSRDNIHEELDLVIIGNAVSKDNIEVLEVMEKNLNYLSMPQAINHFFAKDKKVIMVTGTHGKTTTTGMISWILHYCGLNPSFFIGGIHSNFNRGYMDAPGELFVIEGDEYDTAFFDKKSKFFHFNSSRLVITGIDFDHADIFANVEEIKDSFKELIEKTKDKSLIFAFDSSKELDDVLAQFKNKNIMLYGKNEKSNISFSNEKYLEKGLKFNYCSKDLKDEIFLPMTGDHNIYNCLAAVSVCLSLGLNFEQIKQALKSYKGMKRRQEIRGEVSKIIVIDDFAHHPREVRLTIDGIKKSMKPKRLISVFEPGTNTSMRNVFQEEYENSFSGSDFVCIKKPDKITRLSPELRLSLEKLKEGLNKKNIESSLFDKTDEIVDFLIKKAEPGDIILVMSNKGFDGIHEKILDKLNKKISV